MTDIYSERRARTIIREEIRRQGILLENLEHELKALNESISENLKVQNQVVDHERRLKEIEANQRLLDSTVKFHSLQLKSFSK